jgi:hypothetical protein
MVDAIWSEMGLRYPPLVEPLPAQARTRLADASRLTLRLPPSIPSWCLLHELAHAMTSTHDGQSDGHGPIFIGIYVQLLGRYLRLDQGWLLQTLQEAGVMVCSRRDVRLFSMAELATGHRNVPEASPAVTAWRPGSRARMRLRRSAGWRAFLVPR